MLCQECGKKEATVHFTEIIDGKIIKLHLCEDCAKAKGIALTPSGAISELISSLVVDREEEEDDKLRCPHCGISLKELRRTGWLGCGHCYETFQERLESLIKTIHQGTRHTGKVPSRVEEERKKKVSPEAPGVRAPAAEPAPDHLPAGKTEEVSEDKESKVRRLQKELQAAVDAEEYEKAARLRDRIKEISR
ncbi:MAG: UvrB/UvrC motif-containing protein [Candidatus Euphemobacter frigidus]|nr:UvrB/UvrC motif-containing protein [Candidatus Euphemobacter frigidus]MDP8275816.1 UvrB/UvrC motif-containing protein [Candidatus Euphemobacter frigidus]